MPLAKSRISRNFPFLTATKVGISVKLFTPNSKSLLPQKPEKNEDVNKIIDREMASSLLSVHCFLPSQKKENVGYATDIKTLLCGQALCNPNSLRRHFATRHGSRLVVSSLLGRRVKSRETVVPDPDYRIPIVLLGITGGLAYTNNLGAAIPVGLLGLLLLVQTTRVRFVFYDDALEVKVGDELKESGENVFVGGKNRWKYSTFVNWELWWPNFPILVYFKETQTKPEGQIHFFPVIFNGKQLYDVMLERAGPSQNSGPKES